MKTSVPCRVRALAVPLLLLAAMSQASLHAADGTIHFVGAIVAAPYETTQPTVTTASTLGSRSVARGEVVFERQRIDRPSASMQVQAVGVRTIDLAYADALGRPHAFDSNGVLPVGRDGGRLKLVRPASREAGASAAAALLTVTYD